MDDAKTPAKAVGVMGEPYIFSMRNLPLLEQGTTYDSLATAPNLWLSIKVYASGGENALHAHRAEDHAFIVLQGEAIFTFGDGSQRKVGQYEGVMLPRNVHYKFEADAKQNLVLLRMGGGQRTIEGLLRVGQSSDADWGARTAINMPALVTTVGEMAQALERVAGPGATALIDWTPDENIRRIVRSWPGRVESARAHALGLQADPNFEAIIRAYAHENPDVVKWPIMG